MVCTPTLGSSEKVRTTTRFWRAVHIHSPRSSSVIYVPTTLFYHRTVA